MPASPKKENVSPKKSSTPKKVASPKKKAESKPSTPPKIFGATEAMTNAIPIPPKYVFDNHNHKIELTYRLYKQADRDGDAGIWIGTCNDPLCQGISSSGMPLAAMITCINPDDCEFHLNGEKVEASYLKKQCWCGSKLVQQIALINMNSLQQLEWNTLDCPEGHMHRKWQTPEQYKKWYGEAIPA